MSSSRLWSSFTSLPRRIQALSAAALTVALVLAGLLVAHAARGATPPPPPALQGTDLGAIPAPDFTLTDQNGTSVTLSQLRGHPVILTFFDTVCPHQDCSLMAQYINITAQDMGAKEIGQVTWVAISLNPWHDTPATAKTFLTGHNVTIPMHFVLGSVSQLAPVWSAYHMLVTLQSDGIVVHSTGVYLMDAQGRERIFLPEGFDPKMLSDDVHLLLTDPSAQAVSSGGTQQTGGVSQTRTANGYTVTFTATPGQYGHYNFEVDAWDAQGTPVQGATVTIDLTMPAMPMDPLRETLEPIAPHDGVSYSGRYTVHDVVSMKGAWQAAVAVLPPGAAVPIQATFQFNAKY